MTWRTPLDRRVSGFLDRSLDQGRAAPSYLLSGPDDAGVELLARELAQAILCEGPDRPCQACRHCSRFKAGLHADYVWPEPAGVTKVVGIDEVRELKAAASLEPFEARIKVLAVDAVETITLDAANALLKLLEEPPPRTAFVLTTSEEEAVPETIRSRCQTLRLRPLPFRDVEAFLVADGVEAEAAVELARMSGGKVDLAYAMANDPGIAEEFAEARDELAAIVRMPLADRMRRAARLSGDFYRDREPLLSRLGLWESLWREVLLGESGAPGPFAGAIAPGDELSGVGLRAARDALAAVQSAADALRRNVNPRVAVEALVLGLPSTEAGRETS